MNLTTKQREALQELHDHTSDGDLLDIEFHAIAKPTMRTLTTTKLAKHEGDGLYRITLRGIAYLRDAVPQLSKQKADVSTTVHKYLQNNPGITVMEAASGTGYDKNHVRLALRNLIRQGKAKRERDKLDSRQWIYHPHDGPPKHLPKIRRQPRKHSIDTLVLQTLADNGCMTTPDLRDATNANNRTIYNAMERLQEQAKIRKVGRAVNKHGKMSDLWEHADHPTPQNVLKRLTMTKTEQTIHNLVTDNPGVTMREIADETGFAYQYVQRVFTKMKIDGLIIETGKVHVNGCKAPSWTHEAL